MVCALMSQCNFLCGYFWCQVPGETIDVEMIVRTMKGIYMFKKDSATQVIWCRPWSSWLHPYQSLARKIRTCLELKDQVADPPHPNPTYPDRHNTPSPQKAQASRNWMTKELKKGSRNQQTDRRQYKVRLIEKLPVTTRASTSLIPITTVTTTTTIQPTMSNPMSVTTAWPLTSSNTVNLFVSNPSNISRTQ